MMENLDGDHKFLQEEPVPNVIYPGDKCCILYDKPYFGDAIAGLCLPDFETEHVWHGNSTNFGALTSSFECGKNVAYEI